jgi:hypothetical protein
VRHAQGGDRRNGFGTGTARVNDDERVRSARDQPSTGGREGTCTITEVAGGRPDELWNAPQIARREEMFPRLTSPQLAHLSRLGSEQRLAPGDVLFQPGQGDIPFYVIVEGAIEIFLRRAGGPGAGLRRTGGNDARRP